MQMKFNYSGKPFETYVSFDPAIDHDKTNIREYMETRDVSLLRFHLDQKPTKFYLKNIPRGIFVNGILNASISNQPFLAFQYGIDRIENLKVTFLNPEVEIINNGLNIWEPSEVFTTKDGEKVKYISQDDVEKAFNIQTILEIGSVILKKTQLIPGIKLTYPVLPTSTEIIERMRS